MFLTSGRRGQFGAAGGHRYWRVEADAGGVYGDVISLAALEMRASLGGPNLLTGGMLTASSTLGGYPVSNLLDGNAATFWASSQANDGWNESITADF